MKSIFTALLIFLALTGYVFRTFIGDHYFDGHDTQAHLVRLQQFDKALQDGQFPVRIAGDLYGGRGYPVFNFTYQTPYYLAESLHFFGFSYTSAIKLTFVLAYFASAISMYLLGKYFFKAFLPAMVSALLWAVAPYVFVKIFVTASLGVVTAYVFIPLVFLFLLQKKWLFLGIALAGLILSHAGKLIMFAPLIALVAFFKLKKKEYLPFVISIALALGLSAWYFFPAMLEGKFTHYKSFVTHQYLDQFVPISRLIYSKWGTGAPGISSTPLSQQVGAAQWLSVAAVTLMLLRAKKIKNVLPFFLYFIASVFLMLPISQFIWDLPTPLQSVSPPWRWLSAAVFSAAVCGGWAVSRLKGKRQLALVGILIILTLYGNRNHMRINDLKYYSQDFLNNYLGVATGWNEHLPIWVKDYEQEKAEPLVTGCLISQLEAKSNLVAAKVICSTNSQVFINKAYFPGWSVKVNSNEVTDQVKANLATANGVLLFDLPQGEHQIMAEFGRTTVRQVSELVSLATLLGVIIFYTKRRFLSQP